MSEGNSRDGRFSRRRMIRDFAAGAMLATGAIPPFARADGRPSGSATDGGPADISGVLPRLSVSAGLKGPRSESGIGALMPWGGRLWFITYTSHTDATGSGTGLYYVDDAMSLHKHPASVVGTYANRLVHEPSEQMIIGPHVIDADNNVRTISALAGYRLTATMVHLSDPKNKVYMLGMESHLWEVDVRTLEAKLLFELNKDLRLPAGSWPHYKGGFTTRDRVIVGNNTYYEADETSQNSTGGRLAQWDGKGAWQILENSPFTDINGSPIGGEAAAIAVGWDRASVLLNVLVGGKWTRYRLPKGSRCYDQGWYTEWPRIREIETERFLMDIHGLFYELPRQAYGGHYFGVKPISQHLRMVPDFCSWKGMLVLAGNHNTTCGRNYLVGEPQTNLWFGKSDDLWQFGKPRGWGAVWFNSPVKSSEPSDPFLMTGFEHKCVHLTHDAAETVDFRIEVDFLGDGSWRTCAAVTAPARGYAFHVFPDGFSAHWCRVTVDKPCTATAQFVYT